MSTGVRVSTIEQPVHVSGGIALFDDGRINAAEDVLIAADIALFEAKQSGKKLVRVYHGGADTAVSWTKQIRSALRESRFVLFGQPIVDLQTNYTLHHELLIRMLSENGELIAPGAFLPTAKRLGLMNDIDRWVVREALALARHGESVSINLSAHSIGDETVVDEVRTALRSGIDPKCLLFEITETAAIANMAEARVFAEALSELGCEMALDDFGTGFGSFSYLKHLPSRYLKIDVEFVRDLASNDTDRQVVKAIAEVGHSLGKRIIAEGVEDHAALALLREYGVDFAQGRYLGVPAPIGAVASRETAKAQSVPSA
jgi:EAL domain-containing protein (putative c-di-GMP-specific phosphodiesterase class I)